MNKELQLGKYEFFQSEEKIQRLLDEISPIDEEGENSAKEKLEKLFELIKSAKSRKIGQRKKQKISGSISVRKLTNQFFLRQYFIDLSE
jgi:hypothetical protein